MHEIFSRGITLWVVQTVLGEHPLLGRTPLMDCRCHHGPTGSLYTGNEQFTLQQATSSYARTWNTNPLWLKALPLALFGNFGSGYGDSLKCEKIPIQFILFFVVKTTNYRTKHVLRNVLERWSWFIIIIIHDHDFLKHQHKDS